MVAASASLKKYQKLIIFKEHLKEKVKLSKCQSLLESTPELGLATTYCISVYILEKKRNPAPPTSRSPLNSLKS
jgi:hypothetical protein